MPVILTQPDPGVQHLTFMHLNSGTKANSHGPYKTEAPESFPAPLTLQTNILKEFKGDLIYNTKVSLFYVLLRKLNGAF